MLIPTDQALNMMLGLEGSCAFLQVASRHLAANPLHDPATRILPVYIPKMAKTNRLPTIYFLPSYAADARSVVTLRAWEEPFFRRIDRLISTGQMQPVIVVAVDAWTRLGGSQYVDSIQNGRYASYIIDEVIEAVDRALPTQPRGQARALMGKSSGGFGALHLAMRYPGVVGAIAAHSADGYFRFATQPAFVPARRELVAAGSLRNFVERYERMERPSAAAFETMITLAYAAAYSPRSVEPFAIDLPFDLTTGAIRDDIFARWLEFDPVEDVQRFKNREALRGLRLCYLDCGDRDEYALDVSTRLLAATLTGADVNLYYEEFAGGHRGTAARYECSLAMLSDTLHKAPL